MCARARTFSLAFYPRVGRWQYSLAARRNVLCRRRSMKFGLKTSGSPGLIPPFSDSLAGATAERVREEFESSFCRALAETFIGISSANTASALRTSRVRRNSFLLALSQPLAMINNWILAQSPSRIRAITAHRRFSSYQLSVYAIYQLRNVRLRMKDMRIKLSETL